MRRVEIIANHSIEEDMFEQFNRRKVVREYTKIPNVMGVGNSGPRRGDHIWPEENFILLVYCDDDEVGLIQEAIDELKGFLPDEGIKLFVM